MDKPNNEQLNIVKGKSRPKYVQVSQLLIREINAGHWRAGERLPVESDLAAELDVAVGTLRKALTLLEEEGLLERRQGSGTYVKNPPKEAAYQLFRIELLEGGGTPHAKIQRIIREQNPDVAKHFQASSDSWFWKIERHRFLNEQSIAAEEIWIRSEHCELLEIDSIDESLYRHYRDQFGFWIAHVEDRLRAALPNSWVQETLKINSNHPVGWIERISWTSDERVEEYSRTWFDTEVCQYVSRLS